MLNNPWVLDAINIALRLLLAMLLGGLIGLEREHSKHAAGFRTHILVCIGSALIMLLSMYGFSDFANAEGVNMDPARLAAQVISGIGFLGAGVILYNGFSISGLTTAASLWVVAAIGLAVGAGFYFAAVLTVIIALFSLLILNKVERRWLRGKRARIVLLQSKDSPGIVSRMTSLLEEHGCQVLSLSVKTERRRSGEGEPILSVRLSVQTAGKLKDAELIDRLRILDGILEVSME